MEKQVWTILDENSLPVLEFSSFISLDCSMPAKITSYTVEAGSFATYNKVVSPISLDVVLAIEGEPTTLQNALNILKALRDTTQKVSIASPYNEFKWYSLESFDFSSNLNDGVNLLICNMKFIEIREVQSVYTKAIRKPKNPSASSKVDTGKKNVKSSVLFDGFGNLGK